MAILYLDTEFNGHGGELISMALVCPDGRQWYAAKKLCDISRNSMLAYDAWVAENVLSKLDTKELPFDEFRASFLKFIRQFYEPTVVCDWHADLAHFCNLLQGRDYSSSLDYAFDAVVLKTPPGEPKPENPHNALSDATALMRWHQGLIGPQTAHRAWL